MATRTVSEAGGNYNEPGAWVENAVPGAGDDVTATAKSGPLTIPEVECFCRSIDLSAYLNTLTNNAGTKFLNVGTTTAGPENKALVFGSGMTLAGTGRIRFNSSAAAVQTIDFGGKVPGGAVSIANGNLQLASAFKSTSELNHEKGTLDTNGKEVEITKFKSAANNTRTIKLGASQIKLTGTGTIWEFANVGTLTFESGTSSIVATNTSSSSKTFTGGGQTFYDVEVSGGGTGVFTFNGSNKYHELKLGKPKTVKFEAGSTHTLTVAPKWVGESGNKITIESTTGGSSFTISCSAGTASCDWLKLKDSHAGGGATFYAGANSENVSGNETWKFEAAPGKPKATTGSATSITATKAKLQGTVNPQGKATTFKFEYGPTTAYGSSTESKSAGESSEDQAVSFEVEGLDPNTYYHFRVVATNADGTTQGSDATFGTSDGEEGAKTLREQVASHTLWPVSEAEDAGRNSKYRHKALDDVTDPVLKYPNPTNKPIKVRASIQSLAGVYHPVHFEGEDGNRTVEIPAKSFMLSKPLKGVSLNDGDLFYTNTLVLPVEGIYPISNSLGFIDHSDGTGQKCIISATDYTLTENPGDALESNYGYGPCQIKGRADISVLIGVVGDSISVGSVDANKIEGLADHDNGFLERAFSGKLPIFNCGKVGEAGANFAGNTDMRKTLFEPCTHVIWEYITNDLNSGALSGFQKKFVEAWEQFDSHGAKVYATTCTPRTTSSDSFATTTGQSGQNARFGPDPCDRTTYDEWLRDGAPLEGGTPVAKGTVGAGIARCRVFNAEGELLAAASGPTHALRGGVIDVAATVEVFEATTSTWVWKVSPTKLVQDGTHPNANGHIAMLGAMPEIGEEKSGTSSVTGGGSITSTGTKATTGISSGSGGGNPVSTGKKDTTGVGTITGGGSLTSTGGKQSAVANLVQGGGNLSSTGNKQANGTSSASGGGDIVTVGEAEEEETEEKENTSKISGGGSITTNGFKGVSTPTTCSGGGAGSGAGVKGSKETMTVSGGGVLSGIGNKRTSGIDIVSGGGGVVTSVSSSRTFVCSIQGGGNTTIAGFSGRKSSLIVTGGGDVNNEGVGELSIFLGGTAVIGEEISGGIAIFEPASTGGD